MAPHSLRQRVDRGAGLEAVAGAEEDTGHQFQEAAEGMEQREEAKEDVFPPEFRQGQRAGEAFEHDVAVGELDPLGGAGGARGVHHRSQVADAHRLRSLSQFIRGDLDRSLFQRFQRDQLGAPGRLGVDGDDVLERGKIVPAGQHLAQLGRTRNDHCPRAAVAQDVADVRFGGVRGYQHVDLPGAETGQVEQGHLEAVLREDRHGARLVLGVQGQEPASEGLHAPCDAPPGERVAPPVLGEFEESLGAQPFRAVPEEGAHGEVRGLDQAEDRAGPVATALGGDPAQQAGPTEQVQGVPGQETQRGERFRSSRSRSEAPGQPLQQLPYEVRLEL